MKVFLSDQQSSMLEHLNHFKDLPVDLPSPSFAKKTSSILIARDVRVSQLGLTAFHRYEIFPSTIMRSLPQWIAENRAMQIGDTIVQQVFFPPTPPFAIKLVFGVRIHALIEEPGRAGYGYQTITGHAEKGESYFIFDQRGSDVTFTIETHSSPGNLLTRLVAPLFTLPYQAYCTRKALENIRQLTKINR